MALLQLLHHLWYQFINRANGRTHDASLPALDQPVEKEHATERFGIRHVTVQIDTEACLDQPRSCSCHGHG